MQKNPTDVVKGKIKNLAKNEFNVAKDKNLGKNVGKTFSDKIVIFEKNKHHIFRNAPGHFSLDTFENRKLLLDTVNNSKNFLGTNQYGSSWYARILENGKQVWCEVRDGAIRNGGINNEPKIFNSKTGLSKLGK